MSMCAPFPFDEDDVLTSRCFSLFPICTFYIRPLLLLLMDATWSCHCCQIVTDFLVESGMTDRENSEMDSFLIVHIIIGTDIYAREELIGERFASLLPSMRYLRRMRLRRAMSALLTTPQARYEKRASVSRRTSSFF